LVLSGSNFGTISTVDINVNQQRVGNVEVNDGSFTIVLSTASDAAVGSYYVHAMTPDVVANIADAPSAETRVSKAGDTIAMTRYVLEDTAPLLEEQADGTALIEVPANIAPLAEQMIYLPLVVR
jgi:hypothetical protein